MLTAQCLPAVFRTDDADMLGLEAPDLVVTVTYGYRQ